MECQQVPTYVGLYELTQEGAANIEDSPERIESGKQLVESVGGTVEAFYRTMGPYDYVSVLSFPDGEAAAEAQTALESSGVVRVQLHRTFADEDFADIVAVATE